MSWGRSYWIALALAACSGGKDAPQPAAGSGSGSGSSSGAVTAAPLPGASGTTTITQTGTQTGGPKIIAMDEPPVDLPKQESFQLLDPGTGPREVLRYAATQPWTITTTSELSTRHLDHATWTEAVTVPKFSIDAIVTPDPAHPHVYTLRMVAPVMSAADDDAERRVAKWRKLLAGRLATVAIDDRGTIGTIQFNDDPTLARSAEARDLLFGALRSGVMPVPEQPVGTNARWRVVTLMRLGPFYGKVTTTFTLVGRSGGRWQIRAKTQEVASQQRLVDPALPADVTGELIALLRNADFTGEVDRARPLGAVASATVENRIHMRIARAGAAPVDQMFEDVGTIMVTTSTPKPP